MDSILAVTSLSLWLCISISPSLSLSCLSGSHTF